MPPIRVALFGAGWIMDKHAQGVLDHGGASLLAASSWREPSLSALGGRFGVERLTTRWEDLVEDPSIDAVVVGTPNALHARQTVACLESGKHVLVEKPMARTVEEADGMVAAARRGGAFLMVGHCWRFHPRVLALRNRIALGELGQVVRTHGYGVHAGWGPSGWFTDPELAGGGALVDMGVHAIDTTRFLLGDPRPLRVEAAIATRYGDYEVDDDAVLLIRWDQGAASVVEAGWWQPHLGGLEADVEVFGTSGYDRVFDPPPTPEGYEHGPQSLYSAQMAEFLDAIREGRPPRPDGEDGRVVIEVVEAAYRSAGA
jgi:predicted dehydrogenase